MNYRIQKYLASLGIVLGVCLFVSSSAAAQTFDQNRIIDDFIFNNYKTMTSSQIDTFLNGFSSSCISQNNGFAAPDVTGYSPTNGYTYGGNVSAGTIISHAAQAYGINPQVLLATLQKEQSLVTGTAGCSTLRYTGAVGYGCPDGGTTYNYSGFELYSLHGSAITSVSGTCVNTAAKAGFSRQIIHAAWLLEFGEHRSEGDMGWDVQQTTAQDYSGNAWNSSWDNSDDPESCYSGPMTQGTYQTCPSGSSVPYDGYTTIDGTSVHMDTGATASLYWYTPHFAGNQNFQNIFVGWFGPTITSGFNWQYVSQNAYTDQTKSTPVDLTNVFPGQRVYLTVQAQNVGVQTWTQGIVNLGTSNPLNRSSAFHDSTWPSTNRAATLDQSSVAPGQTGSFSFWVTVPNQPGSIAKEYFDPVADGYSWMNDVGLYWEFNIQHPYQWQYVTGAAYTDQTESTAANLGNTTPGQRYYLSVTVKNTGNMPWNPGVVNLATENPKNRISDFYDSTWLSGNRVASVSSTVQPGQTTTFGFWAKAPITGTGGTFREHFNLVADGIAWMPDNGLYWQFVMPAPSYSWQYVSQNAYTDQTESSTANLSSSTPGQRYYLSLTVKNSGNVVWYPGIVNLATAGPYNRSSIFQDSTWLSANRVVTIANPVTPGQTTTFNFWVQAPFSGSGGTYQEHFSLVADGITWMVDNGVYWQFILPKPNYSWQYIGQNAYTDQTMSTPVDQANLTHGTRYYITLQLKNTGNVVWYPGRINLGTSGPYNRSSAFFDSSWMSTNRPGTISTTTQPGQTATIGFWVKAPSTTGTYKEYFTPVADGITWLADYGVYWQFTVK